MCSEVGNIKGSGEVPPLDSLEDSRDFRSENWGGGKGIVIGGRGIRYGGDVAYELLHS